MKTHGSIKKAHATQIRKSTALGSMESADLMNSATFSIGICDDILAQGFLGCKDADTGLDPYQG